MNKNKPIVSKVCKKGGTPVSDRMMYFLFTDTGTTLAKLINLFTRQPLNHVSISFDNELREVYSFGRKKPRNPFIGGFVKEDIRSDFLKNSECAVYVYPISENDYRKIMQEIKSVEKYKDAYKYNFIGLLGVLLQIEINREYAMFCSQFVATVMREVESFDINKPSCFITPTDIRTHSGLKLIYKGRLGRYQEMPIDQHNHEEAVPKQSFIFQLSRKVKQFVIR